MVRQKSSYRLIFAALALVAAAGCATTRSAAPVQTRHGSTDEHYQDPTAKTLYAMARVLDSQGKETQAESVFRRLVKEYPKFVPAYSDLAGLFVKQGRLEEGVALLEQAGKMSPHDPVLLNNTGVCLLMKGDHEGALRHFREAATSGRQAAKYRANAALALGMLRRDEESLEAYKEVVPSEEGEQNLEIIRTLRGDATSKSRSSDEETAAVKGEAKRVAAEAAAKAEAERVAAEAAAKAEAERVVSEQAAAVEAERVAAEEAAKAEAERVAAEEAAKAEAERVAVEEAAKAEADSVAAAQTASEEEARLAARRVAQEMSALQAEKTDDAEKEPSPQPVTEGSAPMGPKAPLPTPGEQGRLVVVDAEPVS